MGRAHLHARRLPRGAGAIDFLSCSSYAYHRPIQLGAKLILTPLGRRWSLAGSTLVTAGFCILFVFAQNAESALAVRISAIGVGLASTVCSDLAPHPCFVIPDYGANRQCGLFCTGMPFVSLFAPRFPS